jgi:hypothetical protein
LATCKPIDLPVTWQDYANVRLRRRLLLRFRSWHGLAVGGLRTARSRPTARPTRAGGAGVPAASSTPMTNNLEILALRLGFSRSRSPRYSAWAPSGLRSQPGILSKPLNPNCQFERRCERRRRWPRTFCCSRTTRVCSRFRSAIRGRHGRSSRGSGARPERQRLLDFHLQRVKRPILICRARQTPAKVSCALFGEALDR